MSADNEQCGAHDTMNAGERSGYVGKVREHVRTDRGAIETDKELVEKLIETAIRQLDFSYAPYSNFKVGAALLTQEGEIYTGCNIENAAFSPTNCAERTAIFKAVSEGKRSFRAICIVGGKDGILTEYAAPCGVCRQVMMEFCDPDTFRIILAVGKEKYDIFTLGELLPRGFGSSNLA